ncbi:MAG: YibE/F family protein [Firmicutes bacterium]|nr:YibE/F family protein [Bacillota bacterium]
MAATQQSKIRFRNRVIVYFVTLALSVVYLVAGYNIATGGDAVFSPDYEGAIRARVEIINEVRENNVALEGMDPMIGYTIYFEARLMQGPQKNEVVYAMQTIDPYYYPQPKQISEGDKILIFPDSDMDENADWIMMEYLRTDALIWLGVIFGVLLLVFGRIKGFNTIVSLAFTCLSVFCVFIPAVLAGQNVYVWAIVTCIYIVIMTLLIVYGVNRKSIASGFGCIAGVATAGLLTLIMDRIIHLTGMLNESSLYLSMYNDKIDLKAVIFAAIIIGAIGAVMDVSMSIASSLTEISIVSRDPTPKKLIRSGLAIGRDIMGTMANTLVLAYIGSSLSIVLLLVAHNGSMLELMNREMIVVDVLQALVGSFGILLTIPLTSLICAILFRRSQKAREAALQKTK